MIHLAVHVLISLTIPVSMKVADKSENTRPLDYLIFSAIISTRINHQLPSVNIHI